MEWIISIPYIPQRRLIVIYKVLGMAVLALCGAFCGFLMNQSATAKCEQTDNLIKFMRYVRNQVECFALPSSEIVSECEKGLLEGCGFYNCRGEYGFERLAEDCEIYDEESERIVCEFLRGFGKSYREEQLRECDYYLSMLQTRRDELFSELPKKKKVNSTLCISFALCLGLMLI